MKKRVLLIFVLSSIFYFLSSTRAPRLYAQIQTPPQPNIHTANTNPDVPHNLHNWTQSVMIEVLAALQCQLTGIDVTGANTKCLGIDPGTGKISFVEGGGGALGVMSNMVASLYTPQAHFQDYVTYLSNNFGLAKPAYAQTKCTKGLGYCGLSPLITIWSIFRNIVYLLLTVVFTIIGLAIMFRVKIDPRTVMTIGNTIPQIVVGLITVTFSFAIAGLLIDLMWVVIYVTLGISAQASPTLGNDIVRMSQAQNPFEAADILGKSGGKEYGLGTITGSAAESVSQMAAKVFDNTVGRSFFGLLGALIGAGFGSRAGGPFASIPVVGAILGTVVGGVVTAIFATQMAKFLTWMIVGLIVILAVLWSLFRLWFTLLQAYVSILIDTTLAPFWILIGLLPGATINFGAWLRSMLANLSAFPTTIVLFLLGRMFMDSFSAPSADQFIPPMIGNIVTGQGIGPFIGLGIILMAPQAVAMMKEIFKSPELKYTAAIGQALSVGGGVPYSAIQRTGSVAVASQGFEYGKSGAIVPVGFTKAILRSLFGR